MKIHREYILPLKTIEKRPLNDRCNFEGGLNKKKKRFVKKKLFRTINIIYFSLIIYILMINTFSLQ